jgi:hypothetical protein
VGKAGGLAGRLQVQSAARLPGMARTHVKRMKYPEAAQVCRTLGGFCYPTVLQKYRSHQ